MQTNDLGFIASILFVAVPAAFLLILYRLLAKKGFFQEPFFQSVFYSNYSP